MGHSTVSFIVKKMCDSSEIKEEHISKCKEDQRRYGYESSSESYSQAVDPSKKYLSLNKAYTSKGVDKIQLDTYESIVLYILPDDENAKMYSKVYDKIKTLRNNINSLNQELNLKVNEIKNKIKTQKKNVFFKCSACNSSINMTQLKGLHEPDSCPVCNSSGDNFKLNWSDKLYGKSKTKLERKYTLKINKLQEKIKELNSQIPDTVEITPKNKSKIWTLFMADIHH